MGNAVMPRRQGKKYAIIEFDNYGAPMLTKREPIDNLSDARFDSVAASFSEYVLFGGGNSDVSGHYAYVDAYNTSLIHSTLTNLNKPRTDLAATADQSYALFGGGTFYESSGYYKANVDAYNINLTHSTPSELTEGRSYLSAATVGNYSLFAGGQRPQCSTTVDVYNNNLIHTTAANLTDEKTKLAGTTLGDYALFAGGWSTSLGGISRTVDLYDKNLVHSTTADLCDVTGESVTLGNYGGTNAVSIGDYALIWPSRQDITVYDSNLVKTTSIEVEKSTYISHTMSSTSFEKLALFLKTDSSKSVTAIEGFDKKLGVTSIRKYKSIQSKHDFCNN